MSPRPRLPAPDLLESLRLHLHGGPDEQDWLGEFGAEFPMTGRAGWQKLCHPPCAGPCQALMLDVRVDLPRRVEVEWAERKEPVT